MYDAAAHAYTHAHKHTHRDQCFLNACFSTHTDTKNTHMHTVARARPFCIRYHSLPKNLTQRNVREEKKKSSIM